MQRFSLHLRVSNVNGIFLNMQKVVSPFTPLCELNFAKLHAATGATVRRGSVMGQSDLSKDGNHAAAKRLKCMSIVFKMQDINAVPAGCNGVTSSPC
ncbi:unnamed protein product [Closterium sp. Yama58-4]|nr:unnamed protein product [Closterium sp. Yama58-4]